MSFDDGNQPGMTSDDDFRAKIGALLQEYQMGFTEMCQIAGVNPNDALSAIERGTYGLPATAHVMERLLSAFDPALSLAWLVSAPQFAPSSQTERRRRLRILAWDHGQRAGLSAKHRWMLANYVVGLSDAKPENSMRLAARPTIPRTTVDMAHLVERLRRDGFFK